MDKLSQTGIVSQEWLKFTLWWTNIAIENGHL